MIDQFFKTFIVVVKEGSFTKASEKLYLSTTAIMKQMNSLETNLNVKLLNRTKNGISLTAAGKIIYERGQKLIEEADEILKDAIVEESRYHTTFCVGTSLLNPAKPFLDLWYQYNDEFKNYKLHLVPFQDDHENIDNEIDLLGVKYDFLIGVCDSTTWLNKCNFLKLGNYKKMIAVSRNNPLAKKEILTPDDLNNKTLMMVKEGDSKINDDLRHDLLKKCSNLHIQDTDVHYDMSVYNECAESDKLLLNIECWQDVHPGIVSIPVAWDYTIPYGILYAKNSEDDILHFIDILKNNLNKKE